MQEQIDTSIQRQAQAQADQGQIKSFEILLISFKSGLHGFDQSQIKALFQQEISTKIGLGLSFFARAQNVDQLRNDANSLKDKLAGKIELTPLMRENLILPFAEALTLDCKCAFLVINHYFCLNSHRLTYFTRLEKELDLRAQKMQQIQQQGIYNQAMQEEQNRHDQFRNEILLHSATCLLEAKDTYFKERAALLKCIRLCVNQAFSSGPLQSLFDDFIFTKLIREKSLPTNLLEGLLRNLEWEKEFKSDSMNEFYGQVQKMTQAQAREQLLARLQSEQIDQLLVLFGLYFKSHSPSAKEVGLMLNYLKLSQYNGSLGKTYRTVLESPQFLEQQQIISGLGQLASLCMLQLHKNQPNPIITPQNKEIWDQIVDVKELCQVNAPLFFSIVRTACLKDKKVSDLQEVIAFNKEFQESSAIYEILQLLKSSVFSHDVFKVNLGSFYNVVKAWLNLAFPFFKEHRMNDEMRATQQLSMDVLRDTDNVRAIWSEFENDKSSLTKSLQMFQPILVSPVIEISQFLQICDALCGKRSTPFAFQVLGLMEQKQNGNEFLTELFGWVSQNLTKLAHQYSNQEEVESLCCAFVVFSKIIKQSPDLYQRLEESYYEVITKYHKNDLQFNFEQGSARRLSSSSAPILRQTGLLEFDQGDRPFLGLMVRALNLFFSLDYHYSNRVITNLVNAISTLYETDQLRPDIVSLLQNQSHDSVSQTSPIVMYFSRSFIDNELHQQRYKTSESFVKLLCKIFKSQFPQECLLGQSRIELNTSFLSHSLEYVFLPILQNYKDLKFRDAASFGSFIYRFLKLIRLLLEKLLDVPQTQKAPLYQPCPKFDQLLRVIVITLNQINVDRLCLNVLELQEFKTGVRERTKFDNKFIADAEERNQKSKYQITKLQKMISEAFKVINTILGLSLADNDNTQKVDSKLKQDNMSTRVFYIQQLQCVKVISSQILDTNKAHNLVIHLLNGTQVSSSIFGLFTHYLQRSEHFLYTHVEQHALTFLRLACQVWTTGLPEARIPNLLLLLKQDTFSTQLQLQEVFAFQMQQTFINEAKSGIYNLSLPFIDLLCVTADSQPKFVEAVLMSDGSFSSKQMNPMISDAFISLIKSKNQNHTTDLQLQQEKELSVKLLVLFSLLAQRKVCIDLIASRDYEILQRLYDNCVQEVCYGALRQGEQVSFNGDWIKPYLKGDPGWVEIKRERSKRGLLAFNNSLAKVGLVYYMKMLTALYARDPTLKIVRTLITKLFTSVHFKTTPAGSADLKKKIIQLVRQAQLANQMSMNDESDRDIQLQYAQQNYILTNFPQPAQKNEASSLVSQGGVYIQSLFAQDLHESLAKTPLWRLLISDSGSLKAWKTPGGLGAEIYISTQELQYVLLREFYKSPHCIKQYKSVFMELNLALSQLHADCELVQAKRDFILQVIKVTKRENQTKQIGDILMQQSMVPLISQDQVSLGSEDAFTRFAGQILSVVQAMASTLFGQLNPRQLDQEMQVDNQPNAHNYFIIKLQERQLDSLVNLFGMISCWLRQPSHFQRPLMAKLDGKLKNDLNQLVQEQLLPNACALFDFEGCNYPTKIGKYEHSKAAQRTNLKQTYELFINMALQILQILEVLQTAQPVQKDSIQREKLNRFIVQILSKTLESMRNEVLIEKCIQIYQTALRLLDEDTVLAVMKKQDHIILREVLQRLSSNSSLRDSEISAIYQLLINYASTEHGAIHLKEIRVLDDLVKSQCLIKLIDQDLYTTTKVQQSISGLQQVHVRNPVHMQWCQVLILLSTLNNQLVDDPATEHTDYFLALVKSMQFFQKRFAKVLHAGVSLAKRVDGQYNANSINIVGLNDDKSQTMLSLALLEETELIMDVLCQLFEHGHLWQQRDPITFSDLKDYILFGVPKLLAFCESRSLQPITETENHLNTISIFSQDKNLLGGQRIGDRLGASEQDFTGFSLKAEACLIKISLTCASSVLNCMLHSQENQKTELINTWYNNDQKRLASQVLSQQFLMQDQGSEVLRFAFDTLYLSQDRMLDRLITLRSSGDHAAKVFAQLTQLFHNDQWIQQEYNGGMNHFLSASTADISELFNQLSMGLFMSSQVICYMLQTLENVLNQSNTTNFLYSYQHQDERGDVIRKSKEVQDCLDRSQRELDKLGLDIDKEFFSKLQQAVVSVEQKLVRY